MTYVPNKRNKSILPSSILAPDRFTSLNGGGGQWEFRLREPATEELLPAINRPTISWMCNAIESCCTDTATDVCCCC
uniref:Uncharacterized protein n=1 Tax=Oryza sativa subsp. japonica TaxID=39947 RepID=Q6K7Y0_ORYSJ|nr:hypothetical protein [Oryza sativa Japonica Group]